jgi:hypothetical protein
MSTTTDDVHGWVEKQLDSIEARPGMWGPPIAVECQYLLLVETRIALVAAAIDHMPEARHEMHLQWHRIIKDMGYSPVSPLSDQISTLDLDIAYGILTEALSRLRRSYS